jgi:hypothetical protein
MRKLLLLLMMAAPLCPAQKRLVLIDQDGSGPGGSNQMAMLALLQAPEVDVDLPRFQKMFVDSMTGKGGQ